MRNVMIIVMGSMLFGGCSNDDGDNAVSDTTKSGDAIQVSFSQEVQPIFTAKCAISGCHVQPNPKAGLELTSGQAFSKIVNVTSAQCSTQLKLVEPGSLSNSYLVQKLDGAGSCFANDKMPLSGSISSAEVATIKSWIEAGAPNN